MDTLRQPTASDAGGPVAAFHPEGMPLAARIFVAGHRGLAGSAVLRRLAAAGYPGPLTRTHGELNLADAPAVSRFFEQARPEFVFLCAAKVGGILANATYPADFIRENLEIQTNVIAAAHRCEVKRLLFLGSSCVYPRECPQPIREEYLLTGPLEFTNRAYAVAKIAGIEMCRSYNAQYGTEYLAVMPANLYGPGDNFDSAGSHVLAALIRKAHEAKAGNRRTVEVWGSGHVRREFLYSDDLADAAVFLMNLPAVRFTELCRQDPPLLNVGFGKDVTIRELVEMVKATVGFAGEAVYDLSKPDGTPRKLLDVSRMTALGWTAKTTLREGLAKFYRTYLERHATR